MSIVVLVPSRGRPERATDMVWSAHSIAEGNPLFVVAVDPDEPSLATYRTLLEPIVDFQILPERVGYTGTLNDLAAQYWDDYTILGAFGDDVLFRTPGWDHIVEETLATPGIAYGDDLIHGENHPSAVFMSSAIAKALGWLALPATSHQWADDGWKRLGQATRLLRYMPNVIVEHMHPAVDKAEWDDTYTSVFEAERAKADHDGFQAWVADGLEADAARVMAALAVPV